MVHPQGWLRRPVRMARALSLDLRKRVVDAADAGASCRQAAARFGVCVSPAVRWVTRAPTRHHLESEKRGGNHRSHRIDGHRDLILGWIAEEPDLTLAEVGERLAQALAAGRCRALSAGSSRAMASLGTVAKRRANQDGVHPGSGPARPNLAAGRHRRSRQSAGAQTCRRGRRHRGRRHPPSLPSARQPGSP